MWLNITAGFVECLYRVLAYFLTETVFIVGLLKGFEHLHSVFEIFLCSCLITTYFSKCASIVFVLDHHLSHVLLHGCLTLFWTLQTIKHFVIYPTQPYYSYKMFSTCKPRLGQRAAYILTAVTLIVIKPPSSGRSWVTLGSGGHSKVHLLPSSHWVLSFSKGSLLSSTEIHPGTGRTRRIGR